MKSSSFSIKRKNPNQVSFSKYDQIIFIPTTHELKQAQCDLWWLHEEFAMFLRHAMMEYHLLSMAKQLTLKEAKKLLYLPEYQTVHEECIRIVTRIIKEKHAEEYYLYSPPLNTKKSLTNRSYSSSKLTKPSLDQEVLSLYQYKVSFQQSKYWKQEIKMKQQVKTKVNTSNQSHFQLFSLIIVMIWVLIGICCWILYDLFSLLWISSSLPMGNYDISSHIVCFSWLQSLFALIF